MFYVSDITGAQSLYSEELARIQREQAAELLQTERTAELTATPIDYTTEEAAASGSQLSTPSTPSSLESSHVAAGMAGASMLHKGSEGKATSHTASVQDTPSPHQKHDPHRQEISQVRPSLHIKRDPSEPVEFESRGSTSNPYQRLDTPSPPRQKALIASQIMSTPVETLHKADPVEKASKLFQERRFRHVPVVMKGGVLIGIVSDRDFFSHKNNNTRVEKIMTTNVLSARPTTEIRYIAQVLFEERIGAMPIVEEGGKLVGIITRSDILRTVVNQAPLELWV
ncbi:MAG: CBS domain-containing protein [Bdellovibrionales bacterium]|nr:CBS domain-containing protein [Bdellovibrionales bacterium]